MFVSEGLSLEECTLKVPDNHSSLLRELFEISDDSALLASGQELSMYPKPQLSTVSVSYMSQEFSGAKAAQRLNTTGQISHIVIISVGDNKLQVRCNTC